MTRTDLVSNAELWQGAATRNQDIEECLRSLQQRLRMFHDVLILHGNDVERAFSQDACYALAELAREMATQVETLGTVFPRDVMTWSPHEHSFEDWVIHRMKGGAR